MTPDTQADLSPNPWHPELQGLTHPSTELSGDDILFNLADILVDWPGTSTSTLSLRERHDRLVKAVAGYPDIDVATRPLDWSLHPDSVKAMETSLAIDDLPGVYLETSLRSSILNLDSRFRMTSYSADSKEWADLSARCLGLLFAKTNSTRRAKEAMLSAFSSYDNTAGIDGVWRKAFNEEGLVPEFKPDPGDPPERPKTNWPEPKAEWAEYKAKSILYQESKKEHEELKKYEDTEWVWEVAFQFYRVQQWMTELLEHDRGEGTSQRVLRGASLILESMVSEIRDLVMGEFGPGSILIDGGGRLVFQVPSRDDAIRLKKKIYDHEVALNPDSRCLFTEFLAVPRKTASRLERELDCWFDSIEVGDGKGEGERKRSVIEDFAISGLPARRVTIRTRIDQRPQINDKEGLISALNVWGDPPSIVETGHDVSACPFLSADVSAKMKEEGHWGAVDHWIFKKKSAMRKKYGVEVNPTHRLLYIVGHYQRMRDSVLHRPSRGGREEEFHETELCARPVTALVKLDGNSVGHLFSMESNDSPDVVRRRSFRFNAHWWRAIFAAIDEIPYDGGDPVGAWVVAGDDVLLAEYSHAGDPSGNILRSLLDNLSNQLQSGINVELEAASDGKRFLSFSAGYTRKADFEETNNRISPMLRSVNVLESAAGKHWKHEMIEVCDSMVPEDKRAASPPNPPEGEFIETGAGMDYFCGGKRDPNRGMPPAETVEMAWPAEGNWTAESLDSAEEAVVSALDRRPSSYEGLFKILTRCEMRDGVTRVLLKPEDIRVTGDTPRAPR